MQSGTKLGKGSEFGTGRQNLSVPVKSGRMIILTVGYFLSVDRLGFWLWLGSGTGLWLQTENSVISTLVSVRADGKQHYPCLLVQVSVQGP